MVVIEENATAQRDTATNTTRQAEQASNIDRFLGMIAKLQREYPDFDSAAALRLSHESTFNGQGRTSRNERLSGYGARDGSPGIAQWELVHRGPSCVLVNHEEHHFYISGVIRPEDIDGNGQVQSSRMADAQIEFTGRGDLTSGTSQGWFSRVLDFIWPFYGYDEDT